MVLIYNKNLIEIECVMCGEESEFIAPETEEALCSGCAYINEEIKYNYPHKWKYKLRKITEEELYRAFFKRIMKQNGGNV